MDERIYVLGATGNIGIKAVQDLLRNNKQVTILVRDPTKAVSLFGENSKLAVVQGDYDDLSPFKNSIKGHDRLMLLVADLRRMCAIKTAFAEIAYAAGVKQIVDISSWTVAAPWRGNFIANAHRSAEENIVAIKNRGTFVALRPSRFMASMFYIDVHTIKKANAIIGTGEGDVPEPWISTNDIGALAAIVLQDPIDMHGDMVYEMVGQMMTSIERAQLLTKVLGREIQYRKVSAQECYANLRYQTGFPHALAYTIANTSTRGDVKTKGLPILLGREPETMEVYLQANKDALL
ncbi:hypothetical protein BCR43DRAFT_482839 [Syncephalastrum racemosum]|uniref:NmrA-like domain-containing protein n=1 Tax=Syncephalastrum racemosum TaxID=13706 RepID=A0A1X2HUA6_SYNRA|nr:hypothetical protein BCR43DRAFT_482839 [Syncephalastrum racemosum]